MSRTKSHESIHQTKPHSPSTSPLPTAHPHIEHPMPPTSFWGDLLGPRTTGAWWTNLVVEEGDGPAVQSPLALRAKGGDGLQVSYSAYCLRPPDQGNQTPLKNPEKHTPKNRNTNLKIRGHTQYRRFVAPLSECDWFAQDISLGLEGGNKPHRFLRADALTAGVKFPAANGAGSFVARLARGSPYATVEYASGSVPSISSQFDLISVAPVSPHGHPKTLEATTWPS